MKRLRWILAFPLLVLSTATLAQFELPKKLPRIPVDKLPGLGKVPGLDKFLGKEPPVTTSLTDALTEVPFLDSFDPKMPMSPGHSERNKDGEFSLRPGAYHYYAQTYCLKAGTHGPGRGEGYLYAPLKGPKAQIVRSILRRSIEHSRIPQPDIQTLLWAIIAKTKITAMSPEMQRTAAQLLTPKEIFDLNGGALGLIPDEVKQRAMANLPDSVRKVIEAENQIRQMLTQVNASFADLEKVAVLLGEPPLEAGDRTDLPRERWSYHPDGYFVRFNPVGYSGTHVDVSVPGWHEVARDDDGRIVRLSDHLGRRIETTYAPVTKKAADTPLRASSFASVRFISTAGSSSSVVAKWDKTGWVMTGVPGEGNQVAGETLKMTDVADRVGKTRQRRGDLDRLLKNLVPPKAKSKQIDSSRSLRELLDLASFHDALRALAGTQAEKDLRVAQFLEIPIGAWQYELTKAAQPFQSGGSSGGGSAGSGGSSSGGGVGSGTDVDPSGNVGTPGQTGRQRIGQSSRCQEDCACDHEGLCEDLTSARKAALDLGSAAAKLGSALGDLKKHFCDNPAGSHNVDDMIRRWKSSPSPQALSEIRWALNNMMDGAGCFRPPECPITNTTTMMCPHGGMVQGVPTGGRPPTSRGGIVLGPNDTFIVSGCPFMVGGVPSPCTSVMWIPDGSGELSCRSTGIVSNAAGVPQGPVIVQAQPQ